MTTLILLVVYNFCYFSTLIAVVFFVSVGRADFSGIDNAALDFSQLEEYINNEASNSM